MAKAFGYRPSNRTLKALGATMMPRTKMFLFTVEGNGEFPQDMLRYDECTAYSVVDAAKMHQRGKRYVTLKMDNPINRPTVGRWDSFNWKVIDTVDGYAPCSTS